MSAKRDTPLLDIALSALVGRMQPGTQWRTPKQRRLHVLAIVDDEYIVYKVWWKKKRVWYYQVDWVYLFWIWDRDGDLECLKGVPQ